MENKEAMLAIHQKWIADLRSGEYNQGVHTLQNVDTDLEGNPTGEYSYCCLGVLACTNYYDEDELKDNDITSTESFGRKTAAQYHNLLDKKRMIDILPSLNDSSSTLRVDIRVQQAINWNGIDITLSSGFSSVQRHTFREIADFLEQNTDYIFKD